GLRFVEENLNRLYNGYHTVEGVPMKKHRTHAEKLEQNESDINARGELGSSRCQYELHPAIRGSENAKFAVSAFLQAKAWKTSQLQYLLSSGV
ncbi:succinylglutamate desuccinylase, partial [Pseudoalteromonas sp. S558]